MCGVVLALVRNAWGACVDIEEYYTNTGSHQFDVIVHAGGDDADPIEFRRGSLGLALAAALLAAPAPTKAGEP